MPYDAEVEYLESSGTQYIDTGVIPNETTEVDIVVSFKEKNTNVYFGSRYDPYRFCCASFSSGNQFAFGMTKNAWPGTKTTLSTGTFYTLTAKNGSYSVNGTTYSSTSQSSFPTAAKFLLFACRDGNGNVFLSKISIKIIQIRHNGVLIRDMIPVRVGTTGYMYDRVSGQMFGNDGTGDFVVGPDV